LVISGPLALFNALAGGLLHLIRAGWHRWVERAPTAQVVFTGPSIRASDGQRIELADDAQITLSYDMHGTLLTVERPSQSLTLRGEHAKLVALASVLQARSALSAEDEHRMKAALGAVRDAATAGPAPQVLSGNRLI
jgi:hypothetical protein